MFFRQLGRIGSRDAAGIRSDEGTGENVLIRDGEERRLRGKDTFWVEAGDILSIRSPGGGGWGEPTN